MGIFCHFGNNGYRDGMHAVLFQEEEVALEKRKRWKWVYNPSNCIFIVSAMFLCSLRAGITAQISSFFITFFIILNNAFKLLSNNNRAVHGFLNFIADSSNLKKNRQITSKPIYSKEHK